ncbi:UDP-N-acetylmuramoyl-L-alanyl-D-glutamate--2,6-diaminopimelate ligase [Paenibacillus pasadenensis]|uniref:UDP-N-acetylmuramoyl-L-alanyl-D-glutamate--2,6-diaminopimelate ligase n=1 Tax=Paenibacillus pasadenensis TaxID=217090 RepID=A0A2N5N862_9BACL|nr:UDP-N-acetylmuramoyl-L-alanyl-D-glutamate--2,6-diaminopimelate ligase [Paenibacillus pasadenensis]PLT46490.1 UDP-N-acetylmuramoylalanyl-D-glutamate--2,6- diaminopimelate ligase [Paenibacillus pasadenensis]
MRLEQLASQLKTARLAGDGATEITGVERDSRAVKPGDLFLCLPGHTVDGHDFAPQAVSAGAAALVVERPLPLAVPQLIVRSSRHAMAVLADAFYGHPSRDLRVIGVTGTNGKTTTTYLIERILADAGRAPGVIGTIEMRYGGRSFPMSGTTPEALDLHRDLAAMREAGTTHVAMEVSSHALEQGRVKGVEYRTAVFTNLTQDHLDYHGTMDVYREAKGLLFARLGNGYGDGETRYAVLNADDPAAERFRQLTAAEVVTYGVDAEADVRASNIRIDAGGTSFHVSSFAGEADITLRMVGKFNVYNALAALCAGLLEGVTLAQAKASLEGVPGVPGRVESVDAGQDFAVIVDYAHTPDGLENVLRAVKEFAAKRIITVFGCGGDRDRTKRPIMGEIASRYSDYTIVTSDNPRTENPETILLDIEVGLQKADVPQDRYELLVDRREAIEKAVEMASPGDVVLIAGKGHETYQIIGKTSHDFDDRLAAQDAIRGIRN